MHIEDIVICPLSEDEESECENIPYCSFVYGELTAWTLEELCYKNFKKCPVYKEFITKSKKPCR